MRRRGFSGGSSIRGWRRRRLETARRAGSPISSSRRASWRWEAMISLQLDEGAHDGDVHLTARGLRSTLDNMATPCSVKA